MRINSSLIDLIIGRCEVEYNGTHAPWDKEKGNKGLWGRAAYWRITPPGGVSVKITAPVKSIKPSNKTLGTLLRKELKRRIEAIQETCEVNTYGEVHIYMTDPYGIRRLVESIDRAYVVQTPEGYNRIKFFGTGSKALDTKI